MRPLKEHIASVADSLNILKYGELKARTIRLPLTHFFVVLLLAVIISGIIYIPTVISFSNSVKESLDSFERFRLNPDIETDSPAVIWSDDFLVFDTQGNRSANASRYYVDSDFLHYDYGTRRRELTRVGDIVENSDLLGNMILLFAFISLPSFLMSYFILSFLLIGSIVISSALLIWVVTRFPRKKKRKASFRGILVCCLYASTILAIALLLNSIYSGLGIYLIIIFLVYSYIGTIQKVRDTEKQHKKKEKKSSGDDE